MIKKFLEKWNVDGYKVLGWTLASSLDGSFVGFKIVVRFNMEIAFSRAQNGKCDKIFDFKGCSCSFFNFSTVGDMSKEQASLIRGNCGYICNSDDFIFLDSFSLSWVGLPDYFSEKEVFSHVRSKLRVLGLKSLKLDRCLVYSLLVKNNSGLEVRKTVILVQKLDTIILEKVDVFIFDFKLDGVVYNSLFKEFDLFDGVEDSIGLSDIKLARGTNFKPFFLKIALKDLTVGVKSKDVISNLIRLDSMFGLDYISIKKLLEDSVR